MKNIRILLTMFFIILASSVQAEIRTYIQVKDVSAKQTGKVNTSTNRGDLFEFTYDINQAGGIIKRIKIRRLDQNSTIADNTTYKIMKEQYVLGSKAGEGGNAVVAISQDGSEIISLGDDFAFTSRTSNFSQMITGVYKRVY